MASDTNLTWGQKRKLLKYFEPSIKGHPQWPVIICEGDSWFSFPIHKNTIDFLDDMCNRKISLLRLEASGDKALRIIGGKQKIKLASYLKRYPVNALLFSGGGNDVVGADLLPLLNQKLPGMTWRDCINQATTDGRFARLRSAYLDLIHLRNENRPSCRIYTHGYDWSTPTGKGTSMWGIKVGPWMKPNLEKKGITDPADQQSIIRELLQRFQTMLQSLAQEPDFVVVPTIGTLAPNEWNDELHPTRKGFEKIAEKFRAALKKQFPQTFRGWEARRPGRLAGRQGFEPRYRGPEPRVLPLNDLPRPNEFSRRADAGSTGRSGAEFLA